MEKANSEQQISSMSAPSQSSAVQAQQQYLAQAKENTIDFASQVRREKALAEEKVQLKVTNAMNAFNLLQDLRHLIILDFRTQEEFDKSHIRKAVRADITNYKEKIAGYLVSLHHKAKPGAGAEVKEEQAAVQDEAKDAQVIEEGADASPEVK